MHPILFSIGSLHLYSFGVMVALGTFVSLFLMSRRARRDGFPEPNDVLDLVFVTLASGFLGSRLHYVLQNAGWYRVHPLMIFALWEGGLIFYGGMVTALIALFVFMKVRKIPYLRGLDFLFLYLPLVHAFGRIGCFLNGCCYGRACALAWAVKFPELPQPVHPTQLYESVFDIGLFFFLSRRYGKKHFSGEITALYIMGYAAGRFVIEFLRAGNPSWMFLTWNQSISVSFFLAGLIFYGVRNAQTRHSN